MIDINNPFEEVFDIHVPEEKIKLFVERVIKEKGYTLEILGQEIQQGLQAQGMHNIVEDSVYKKILLHIINEVRDKRGDW